MQHFIMDGREVHIARSAASDTGLCGVVGDPGGGAFTTPTCGVCISIANRQMSRTAHSAPAPESV